MKAKKLLLCGIIAVLSVPVMADSAQEALKNARDGYYKTLKETPRTKTEKLVTIDKEQGGVVEEKEIVKPKSQIEKLEYNMAKAKERIDFYERVVRGVQREEKELGDFDSVIKRDGIRKARRAKK